MGLFDFISGVADTMNMMKARTLVDELRHSIMPYDNTWRDTESFVNGMRKKKANGTKIDDAEMSTLRSLAKFYDADRGSLIMEFPYPASIAQKEIFENAYAIVNDNSSFHKRK